LHFLPKVSRKETKLLLQVQFRGISGQLPRNL